MYVHKKCTDLPVQICQHQTMAAEQLQSCSQALCPLSLHTKCVSDSIQAYMVLDKLYSLLSGSGSCMSVEKDRSEVSSACMDSRVELTIMMSQSTLSHQTGNCAAALTQRITLRLMAILKTASVGNTHLPTGHILSGLNQCPAHVLPQHALMSCILAMLLSTKQSASTQNTTAEQYTFK